MRASVVLAVTIAAVSGAHADPTKKLIGLTEEQLLSCAGIPAGSMAAGATTFFQYGEFNEHGQIIGMGSNLFVAKRQKGCQAAVSLKGGKVVKVTLKTKGLLTGPLACDRIFSDC